MCYSIDNGGGAQGNPESRRDTAMIKVTACGDNTDVIEYFETVGAAVKWLRNLAGKVTKWRVYGTDGAPYYAC